MYSPVPTTTLRDRRPVEPRPSKDSERASIRFPTAFDRYIHDLGDHAPVPAEQELAFAQRIRARRGELWRTLASYPPLAAPMCGLIDRELQDKDRPKGLDDALELMRAAGRSARRARSTAGQDAFRAAGEALAKLLVDADQDDLIARTLVEDIAHLRFGNRDLLRMTVRRAPSLNRPFLAYCERSARAMARLDDAKREFAAANLRLVVSMAKKFEYSKIPLADLVQEGNLGLLKAVDRFDHRRGFRFSTYATWWIRHALTRAVYNGARTIRLPVHIQERQRKIAKFRREFERKEGRPPSDAEVAERLSIAPRKVASADLDRVSRSMSLDAPASPRAETPLAETLHDPESESVDALLERHELLENLDEGFAALDAVELDIVQRRFGLGGRSPETLRQVGASHGLSRERIRQIQARAMLKMRAALMGDMGESVASEAA